MKTCLSSKDNYLDRFLCIIINLKRDGIFSIGKKSSRKLDISYSIMFALLASKSKLTIIIIIRNALICVPVIKINDITH